MREGRERESVTALKVRGGGEKPLTHLETDKQREGQRHHDDPPRDHREQPPAEADAGLGLVGCKRERKRESFSLGRAISKEGGNEGEAKPQWSGLIKLAAACRGGLAKLSKQLEYFTSCGKQ